MAIRSVSTAKATPRLGAKLLIGVEDLLGVVSLGFCVVTVATTWVPSPEAFDGPPTWAGYLIGASYGFAAVLAFLASHHLHRTASFSPFRHAAPVLCALMVPVLTAASAPL